MKAVIKAIDVFGRCVGYFGLVCSAVLLSDAGKSGHLFWGVVDLVAAIFALEWLFKEEPRS